MAEFLSKFLTSDESADGFAEALPSMVATMNRGRAIRVFSAVVTAAVCLRWIDWTYYCLVIPLVLTYEYRLQTVLLDRLVFGKLKSDPRTARYVYAAMAAFGACIYAAFWAPAFVRGGGVGVYLGAAWFWGAIVYNTVYLGRDRLILLSCVIPPLVVIALAPFVAEFGAWSPWIMLVVTAQGVAAMAIAARDRLAIAEDGERDRVARKEAEEANVAKSQFLATMSHELRTPLNAIIGYAEILEEDLEDAPDHADPDDARRIRRAARHLLTLINEVLDLSKIEAGHLELINGPVDIAALLRDVEETVRPIGAGNGNRVVLDVIGDMPLLDTDGARLKQCLLNLATNACKFTRDGRVTVRAGLEMRDGAPMLEVAVIDTGIGIKPEDQARLFTPFIQVDGSDTRTQDGTGLGLVITRKLAQAMGGDVSMISTAGVGSTFTLSIAATRHVQTAPAVDAGGPSVLVIEDDPTARDLTCRALTRLSFNVRATATATEGLDALAAQRPDLVILDIHLPDLSGWTVLERIKTMPGGHALPVLVVTIDDDRQRALALGACEHMVKPVDRDRLTAAAVRYALPKAAPAATPRVIATPDMEQFG